MTPRVLVVSQRRDVHVERVATALLRAGAKMELLDLGAIPRELSVAVGHDAEGSWRARLIDASGALVALEDLSSVWWRRPTPYLLHDGLPAEYGAFAMAQLHEAMVGVWTHLQARWINPPWADQAAGHKLRQLELAGQVGLQIPRTVVTTSPSEARAFLEGLEGRPAILKVLAPTAAFCPYTRLVTASDLQRLDALRLSPVILQEYVPGVDLRVTAVCQELFTAEIDARATSAPHDFRQVQAACSVKAGNLPPQYEARILALMGRLGLAYGALDFWRAEDGRLVFLEVNPGGQWLFVEERTGQPITAALAAVLAGQLNCARAAPPVDRSPCPTPPRSTRPPPPPSWASTPSGAATS